MSLFRALAVLCLLALVVSVVPTEASANQVPVELEQVYFEETGHHVPHLFVDAWWRFGGLPIIGYPVSEPFERDGMLVQHFERAVMEWHADKAGTRYEVQLELLGNWVAGEREHPAFEPLSENPMQKGDNGYWFPETGHSLQGSFKAYWDSYGGLQVFGYPISQEFEEDGRAVQYFERARFEWHPEHTGTVYEVLLGHLGVEAALAAGVDTTLVPRQDDVPVFVMRPPERNLALPVLMYHRLGDNIDRYEISYWNFEQQLAWLRDSGYQTVTLDEVYDYLYGYGSLPANPVVLTFDDGWWSHWEAAAMLERYGMRGVFFITLDDQPRMPDWQIRALAERGHEIGAHTNLHPDLTGVDDERLWNEVAVNRQRLQEISGSPVEFFAYPYGSYDWRVMAAVEAAGYRGAVAAWGGSGWSHDRRWNQPRIEVVGWIDIEEFANLVR